MPKTQKKRTRIETNVHDEAHRCNIPTTELGSFLTDQDREPKPVLYPRDPSLDPQLVWKGKDEQDRHPLEVPAVPIYIQEKIHPKALIETLRAEKASAEKQLNLWGDFNGIEFEELVEFYQHNQHWSNRMILGDSLLVMTSLAEKEGLKGQARCIVMDPPYGISFDSNWQVSTRKRDVRDGRAEDLTRQPEQIKAFRDTWEGGVHSYLTYLRDRLFVARELLAPGGSIFMQMGDENIHLVRSLLDEVFGPENAHPLIVFRKKMMPMMREPGFESTFDYLLWYQKEKKTFQDTLHPLFEFKSVESDPAWSWVELPDGSRRKMTATEAASHALLPKGSYIFQPISMLPRQYRPNQDFEFELDGVVYPPPKGSCWSTTREGMQKLAWAKRLHPSGDEGLRYVYYLEDYPVGRLTASWMDTAPATNLVYAVQTTTKVIERVLAAATDPGDLVIDPTCGSGTTAYVAESLARRWITIDTSRVALALARTRLMTARYPYFILLDSPQGRKLLAEREGIEVAAWSPIETAIEYKGDISKGFAYEIVPHITLGSIANNPDLRENMSHQEIRKAIARHAVSETLFDRPARENQIVRVSGPFTVESLSPHVTLPLSRVPLHGSDSITQDTDNDDERFQRVVLGYLRKAGVQNTVRSERLVFDSIEPWAGRFVHAVGIYNENGVEKRAAISIGPEYGTVDAELVRRSAREAVDFADLLIVCGFAFDGYIAGELRQLGKLTILKAAMNPDLAMGDDLLKKTGSGNLFMVFGEPDIEARTTFDGLWEIEVKGVDVYNPTTGEIRSHSTDDIACWFIDTSYNGESFFVRHAYFCGGNEPYESLKRALRADIDEEAWNSLYRTTSRPFPIPETGRIAVKVINHYGDEVMKVLEIGGV